MNLQLRMPATVLGVGALLLTAVGCQDMGKRTAIGAGAGAVVGGATGAIIGHQSGNRTEGALIGAAAGAALGGGVGYLLDRQAAKYQKINDVEVYKMPPQDTPPPYYYEGGNTYQQPEPVPERLMLRISSDVLFPVGSAALSPQGTQRIAEIAQVMNEYPGSRVIVKGYASSDGDDAANQALSQRRADNVRNTLIANGVPAGNIDSLGFGESDPIGDNATPEGRAMNRRVEIEVIPPRESAAPSNSAGGGYNDGVGYGGGYTGGN